MTDSNHPEILATSIDMVDPVSLTENPLNPRNHPETQISQLMRNMREFGFTIPVLATEGGEIIAGHGRVMAAIRLGMPTIPVIRPAGWSQEKINAYMLADNRLAESSGWDNSVLAQVFESIGDFDLSLTGFDESEVEKLLEQSTDLRVFEVDFSTVQDRFWISVYGDLPQQAFALQRLRAVMSELPGVEVKIVTIKNVEV